MTENKTPDWLIDIQNKSWEPEILISGITLTSLFLLSDYIYNFFGSLIQEFGVRYVVGRNLYLVAVIILTGLKSGLIIHLILRGLWTGLVGLSYVFPQGVNKKFLAESKRIIEFQKPEIFVIQLEKICSLLFSFIFSSIFFVGSFCIGMIPFALLYISGLDVSTIKMLILYLILPAYVILGIIWIVLASRKNTPKIIEKMENSIFSNIITVYFTNIGKGKTLIIFMLYLLVIGLLTLPDFYKFDFNNKTSIDITPAEEIVRLNNDNYEDRRDANRRVSRAAIGSFRVSDKNLELFISYYREDQYTLNNLRKNKGSLSELSVKKDTTALNILSLYDIYVDDKHISPSSWYRAEHSQTNQNGFFTKLEIDSLESGFHQLKINKIYWVEATRKKRLIENWDIVTFSLE